MPGTRAVLLHGEVAQVRVVVDEQLDHRVDEVVGLGRAEAVEHRGLGALAERDERVRERRPTVALAPVQHEDRIFDDDARGHVHERAPARNASCSTVNASSDALDARAEQRLEIVVLARRDSARAHTLGLERGVELVVHDATVAHDDHPGVTARLRRPRTAARRALVAGPAELGFGERPVAREVEVIDARVAPDLLRRRRPRQRRRAVRPRPGGAARASRGRRAPATRRG